MSNWRRTFKFNAGTSEFYTWTVGLLGDPLLEGILHRGEIHIFSSPRVLLFSRYHSLYPNCIYIEFIWIAYFIILKELSYSIAIYKSTLTFCKVAIQGDDGQKDLSKWNILIQGPELKSGLHQAEPTLRSILSLNHTFHAGTLTLI